MGSRGPTAASLLFVSLILAIFTARLQAAEEISVYWGQNAPYDTTGTCYEGSLKEACQTRYYKFVNIAFMHVFGGGQTPQINLACHCDPASGGCRRLSDEIEWCQQNGVKVFLSLGGGAGNYILRSEDDARNVAEYIWNNFLSGSSSSRPFGDAVLDGVDLDIEGGTNQHWDSLAVFLKSYNQVGKKTVYLSAAPQCPFPDYYMQNAINTGLIDYLWIQFYNNYCQFSGNSDTLVSVWKQWQNVPVSHIFLGLPASPQAAGSGYVTPEQLCGDVLPKIRTSPKFSGIMLWSRYYDKVNSYSAQVIGCLKNLESSSRLSMVV